MPASTNGKDTHTQSLEPSTKSSLTDQELIDLYGVESFVPVIAKKIMAILSAAPSEAFVKERQNIKRAREKFLRSAIESAKKDQMMKAEAQKAGERWKEVPLGKINGKKSRGVVATIEKYENSSCFDERIKQAVDEFSTSCQSIKVTLEDHLKKQIPKDDVLSEKQV